MNFKMAVSWLFHSEDEQEIFNRTGWNRMSDEFIYAEQVVELLREVDADYDVVSDWGDS